MNEYLSLGLTIFAGIFGWTFLIILIKYEKRNKE